MVNNQLLGYSMVGFVLLVYLRLATSRWQGRKATHVHLAKALPRGSTRPPKWSEHRLCLRGQRSWPYLYQADPEAAGRSCGESRTPGDKEGNVRQRKRITPNQISGLISSQQKNYKY